MSVLGTKNTWKRSLFFYCNICPLFFRGTTQVFIFVLATARCVILIMICATEKSEMVMSWIPSIADSWNGSYFNFLYSMNIIYFDMCKWGFMHLKVNRKSRHDYMASPQQHRFYSNLPPTTVGLNACYVKVRKNIWLCFLLFKICVLRTCWCNCWHHLQ